MARFDHPGLVAAQAIDSRRFMAWGPAGLAVLDLTTRAPFAETTTWLRRAPVLSVARWGSWTYVLVPDGTVVFDRHMCPAGWIEIVDGWHLAATARRLVVAARDRITVHDLDNPRQPAASTSIRVPNLVALATARIPGESDGIVATDRLGGAQLIDAAHPRDPRVIASLERDRWFTMTARTRKSVVRRGADGESLEVFRIVERHRLNRRELEADRRKRTHTEV